MADLCVDTTHVQKQRYECTGFCASKGGGGLIELVGLGSIIAGAALSLMLLVPFSCIRILESSLHLSPLISSLLDHVVPAVVRDICKEGGTVITLSPFFSQMVIS